MANNANNAVVGKPLVAGGILVAPVGTALPTTEIVALNASFKSVGYITDDGLSRTEKINSDTKYAWGGDTLAVLYKSKDATLKFGLAEYLNPLVPQVIYGTAAVTVTAATSSSGAKLTVGAGNQVPPKNTWVFEIVSGPAKVRLVAPVAQISDLDDVTYKDDDISARGVTLTLFPDANGVFLYEYTNDGVLTP
jgi:hypothetical protein